MTDPDTIAADYTLRPSELAETRLTLGHYSETTTYNDQASHCCILKAFDIAIAAADSPSAGSLPGRSFDTESAP